MMTTSTSQASRHTIQLPSIVGPHVYEVYTDAKFFITHLYVNGHKVVLSNAEGGGSMRGNGYRLDGAMGYPNKSRINGFLKAGSNRIHAVFEPSPVLSQAIDQDMAHIVLDDMLARVVVLRGELNTSDRGMESAELDKALADPALDVTIVENKLLSGLTKEDLEKEVSVDIEFDIPSDEKVVPATIKECELSSSSSRDFSANLFINSVLIRTYEGNGSSGQASFIKNLKNGGNEVKFEVTAISEAEPDETEQRLFIDLLIRCDLRDLLKDAGISKDHYHTNFGTAFNHVDSPLLSLEFSEPGAYQGTFDIEFDTGEEREKRLAQEKQAREDALVDRWQTLLKAYAAGYASDNEKADSDLRAGLYEFPDISTDVMGRMYDMCGDMLDDAVQAKKAKALIRRFVMDKQRERLSR